MTLSLAVIVGVWWIVSTDVDNSSRVDKLTDVSKLQAETIKDQQRRLADHDSREEALRQALLAQTDSERQAALDRLRAIDTTTTLPQKGTLGSSQSPATTTTTTRPAGRTGQPGGQTSPSTTAPPQTTSTTSAPSTTSTTNILCRVGICPSARARGK